MLVYTTLIFQVRVKNAYGQDKNVTIHEQELVVFMYLHAANVRTEGMVLKARLHTPSP
jgi:hypothetical protein